jgi:hypothetical protein
MESSSPLLCSQEPAVDPYSEPDESNSLPPTVFPKCLFRYSSVYAQVFVTVYSL